MPELEDHERPLLEKGKKKIKLIIEYLLENRIRVDYILSSTAVRSLDTAHYIARALRYPVEEIKVDHRLYQANLSDLADQFLDLSNRHQSVMIVAHNPACTSFINLFADPKIDSLPASGIVCIAFDTKQWDQIFSASREICFIVTPKQLRRQKQKLVACAYTEA